MKKISIDTRISRREPGKTPLIDIIFILLIFFLVTMSTNLGNGDSGESEGEERSQLPVIETPNELRSGYLLIDVFDLKAGGALKRDMIEDLRGSFVKLASSLGMDKQFAEIPAEGFAVSVCGGLRFEDISAFRETSEVLLEMIDRGADRRKLRERAAALFEFYPAFLPAEPEPLKPDAVSALERKVSSMAGILEIDRIPGVHIRIPEDIYMYFLKSAFLVLDDEGFDIDRIRIHAMKE